MSYGEKMREPAVWLAIAQLSILDVDQYLLVDKKANDVDVSQAVNVRLREKFSAMEPDELFKFGMEVNDQRVWKEIAKTGIIKAEKLWEFLQEKTDEGVEIGKKVVGEGVEIGKKTFIWVGNTRVWKGLAAGGGAFLKQLIANKGSGIWLQALEAKKFTAEQLVDVFNATENEDVRAKVLKKLNPMLAKMSDDELRALAEKTVDPFLLKLFMSAMGKKKKPATTK
ncbi:MAG: hypothetical protein ABH884_00390 [Candidatus Komeilibacteria bacterium]